MCSMLDFKGSANGEAAIPSRRCGSTPRLHLDIALRRLRRNPGAEPPPLDRLPDRGAAVNLDAPGASHPGVVWRSRTRVYRSYILWDGWHCASPVDPFRVGNRWRVVAVGKVER